MALIEELLEREEGFVPYAYEDSEGWLTIGIGTMIDKRRGGGISYAAAIFMLQEKLDSLRDDFDARIPWWRSLNEARQAVLLSMGYQLGAAKLMKFKRTLAFIERGEYGRAATAMLESLWARQTPNRARRHARAMERGTWS